MFDVNSLEPCSIYRILEKIRPLGIKLTPQDRMNTFSNNNMPLNNEGISKLESFITLVICDDPMYDWVAFSKCNAAINGLVPNMFVPEKSTPAQCAYTIYNIEKVIPEVIPGYFHGEYTNDIYGYIASCAMDLGYIKITPYLPSQADELLQSLLSDLGKNARVAFDQGKLTGEIFGVQSTKISVISEYLKLKMIKINKEGELVKTWQK
jgi:hypothetical protein